jgi:hypothetical protein
MTPIELRVFAKRTDKANSSQEGPSSRILDICLVIQPISVFLEPNIKTVAPHQVAVFAPFEPLVSSMSFSAFTRRHLYSAASTALPPLLTIRPIDICVTTVLAASEDTAHLPMEVAEVEKSLPFFSVSAISLVADGLEVNLHPLQLHLLSLWAGICDFMSAVTSVCIVYMCVRRFDSRCDCLCFDMLSLFRLDTRVC